MFWFVAFLSVTTDPRRWLHALPTDSCPATEHYQRYRVHTRTLLGLRELQNSGHPTYQNDGPKAYWKPQSGPRCPCRANYAEVDERQRVLEVLEFLGGASFFAVGTARFLSSPAKSFRVKFINATALILPDSSYYPATFCPLSPQTAAFKTQTARTVMILGEECKLCPAYDAPAALHEL
ncbi:hypothetical protein B0H16DRAFT_1456088 [Mycena metata]|uniref:Uncharacterized protein n=1 Tax=Mycena metata TaxID=1033252 RepID=A0AAD7JBI7_9AGAR|nr:hypothetical protein B0H16DRAFT_1456088 [Mycena metata]